MESDVFINVSTSTEEKNPCVPLTMKHLVSLDSLCERVVSAPTEESLFITNHSISTSPVAFGGELIHATSILAANVPACETATNAHHTNAPWLDVPVKEPLRLGTKSKIKPPKLALKPSTTETCVPSNICSGVSAVSASRDFVNRTLKRLGIEHLQVAKEYLEAVTTVTLAKGAQCKGVAVVTSNGTKLVAKDVEYDPLDERRLSLEIECLTRCAVAAVPYVVKFGGLSYTFNEVCILTEYAEAGSLWDLYKAVGARDERCVQFVAFCVLTAMARLNELGFVHGDVKLQNMVATVLGEVLLLDFGCASRVADCHERTATGTMLFRAPELARGVPYGVSCDVYSAAVAVAMLSYGCFPFPQPDRVYDRGQPISRFDAEFPHAEMSVSFPEGFSLAAQQFLHQTLAISGVGVPVVRPSAAKLLAESPWMAEARANLTELQSGFRAVVESCGHIRP